MSKSKAQPSKTPRVPPLEFNDTVTYESSHGRQTGLLTGLFGSVDRYPGFFRVVSAAGEYIGPPSALERIATGHAA